MNKRFVVLLMAVLVLLAVPFVVSAQSSVPNNGTFSGSLSGWWSLSGSTSSGIWLSSDGVGGNGSFQNTGDSIDLVSSPFVPSGSSAVSWYFKHPSGGGCYRVGVLDWEGVALTWLMSEYCSLASTWTDAGVSLASYSGKVVSLVFHSRDGDWRFDSVYVSSASNADVGLPKNSTLSVDSHFWYGTSANGNGWLVSGGNPGGRYYSQNNGGSARTFVYPFRGGGSWTFDVYGDNPLSDSMTPTVAVYVFDLSAPSDLTHQTLAGAYNYPLSWTTRSLDLSAYAGKNVAVYFDHSYHSGSARIYFDNFLCVSGCYSVNTPTPTVGGFPYGVGTPLPVDWSQFPTQAPYPTFPPFPTAVYGPGTPVPVIQVTPFPTQLPHATPIYDRDTPIPILWPTATRTATFVPVPTVSSGVVADPLAQVDFRNANIQYVDPLPVRGGSGSSGFCDGSEAFGPCLGPTSSDVVDVHFARKTYDYTIYNIWGFDRLGLPNMGVRFHILYPDRLVYAGINLLAPIYGLAGMFFLVFVLRTLQKR